MPLVQRKIAPSCILSTLQHVQRPSANSEHGLQSVFVGCLAGVLRQLGSLAKQSEDLFGQILVDIGAINDRANKLKIKMKEVKEKVSRLDPIADEVRMDVIGETHFHSHVRTDQRILDPKAIYNSVRELCNGCDRKPALQEFNKYREDNKDAMKFYTDPTYFFNLWVDDQRKHLRKTMVRKKKKRHKRNITKKEGIEAPKRKVYKTELDMLHEDTLKGKTASSSQSRSSVSSSTESHPSTPMQANNDSSRNVGKQVPTSPVVPSATASPSPKAAKQVSFTQGGTPPGPSPVASPLPTQGSPSAQIPTPPAVPTTGGIPPPPVPPPPPSITSPSPLPNKAIQEPASPVVPTNTSAISSSQFSPTANQSPAVGVPPPPAPAPPPAPSVIPPPPPAIPNSQEPAATIEKPKQVSHDPRNNLLDAIRKGKQLKKVEEKTQVQKQPSDFDTMNVASILARRVAFVSDSESDDEDDEYDDDDDWD